MVYVVHGMVYLLLASFGAVNSLLDPADMDSWRRATSALPQIRATRQD
jgi:hypothetical protein